MSAPTLLNRLPPSVAPRKLVNMGVSMEGVIPPESVVRLGQAVEAVLDPVEVSLYFGRDERPEKVVTGRAVTRVNLRCERCLAAFGAPLHADIAVAVVWSEEEAFRLPASLDPWLVTEDDADLVAMVEDELLLALPIVALHPSEADCEAPAMSYGPEQSGDTSEPPQGEQRENPFSILEQLKGGSKKE